MVPLEYAGKAKGVDLGGELQIVQTQVTVKSKPMLVPDVIEIDINDLNQGDSINCEQLDVADGVMIQNPANMILVSVI